MYAKLCNPQLGRHLFHSSWRNIFFQSYFLLIFLVLVVVSSAIVSITVEEKQLLKRYGKEYELYAKKVSRFIYFGTISYE